MVTDVIGPPPRPQHAPLYEAQECGITCLKGTDTPIAARSWFRAAQATLLAVARKIAPSECLRVGFHPGIVARDPQSPSSSDRQAVLRRRYGVAARVTGEGCVTLRLSQNKLICDSQLEEHILDLATSLEVTTALLRNSEWRARVVEQVRIEKARSCRTIRALQAAPLAGVIDKFVPTVNSQSEVELVLPVAAFLKRPLVNFGLTAPTGHGYLLKRGRSARRISSPLSPQNRRSPSVRTLKVWCAPSQSSRPGLGCEFVRITHRAVWTTPP